MSIAVACPDCGFRGNVPENFLGKKIKCRNCGGPFHATPADSHIQPSPVVALSPSEGAVPRLETTSRPAANNKAILAILTISILSAVVLAAALLVVLARNPPASLQANATEPVAQTAAVEVSETAQKPLPETAAILPPATAKSPALDPKAAEFFLKFRAFLEDAKALARLVDLGTDKASFSNKHSALRESFARIPDPPPGDDKTAKLYDAAKAALQLFTAIEANNILAFEFIKLRAFKEATETREVSKGLAAKAKEVYEAIEAKLP